VSETLLAAYAQTAVEFTPKLRGMTAAVDPRTGDPQNRVPGLVRARGAELGLRSEALPGLQSSLALWRLDFASKLSYSGAAGTTLAQGLSRRYGLEWDDITTGPFVPNSVDRVFTGTVTLKDLGPWTLGLTEHHIGAGPLTCDNSVRAHASLVANLRVSRRLTPNSALTVDVLNLFGRRYNDIEYFYATQLPGEAAPVNDRVIHPGEPRTLRLTLRVDF
jgi:outer membrane receptor protein involved in Fe transport